MSEVRKPPAGAIISRACRTQNSSWLNYFQFWKKFQSIFSASWKIYIVISKFYIVEINTKFFLSILWIISAFLPQIVEVEHTLFNFPFCGGGGIEMENLVVFYGQILGSSGGCSPLYVLLSTCLSYCVCVLTFFMRFFCSPSVLFMRFLSLPIHAFWN